MEELRIEALRTEISLMECSRDLTLCSCVMLESGGVQEKVSAIIKKIKDTLLKAVETVYSFLTGKTFTKKMSEIDSLLKEYPNIQNTTAMGVNIQDIHKLIDSAIDKAASAKNEEDLDKIGAWYVEHSTRVYANHNPIYLRDFKKQVELLKNEQKYINTKIKEFEKMAKYTNDPLVIKRLNLCTKLSKDVVRLVTMSIQNLNELVNEATRQGRYRERIYQNNLNYTKHAYY